ncbi:MAG: cobalamin biosynthesis protein [Propionibacteriaceae bacterium]|nr:cobalamin biosynthesis protein [Propionibacteriaceae bacterium]
MSRALGLVLGVAADAVVGDPRRGHPVAIFGSWAAAVERRLHADARTAGAAFTAVTLAPVLVGGVAIERLTRRHGFAHTLATAAVTWACLGARSLAHEGHVMADRLVAGDLDAAREQLPHLCGRSPEGLAADELGRATVESLAENTNDAVVSTLAWGVVAGIPGMAIHRAVNTLDAMVGYRNDRYARFGTASARFDDVLGWLPARLTGAVACAVAPLVGGDRRRAVTTMLRDAADHPSPNGGWCEAAWAGALGIRLGGANTYGSRIEVRGTLGDTDWPRPDGPAVRRAASLVTAVSVATTVLAAASATLTTRRSR